MHRITAHDILPNDEPIYPSVPWPAGRETFDAEAPDRSGIAEDAGGEGGAEGERAFAATSEGIPRRRDHI